MLTKDVADMKHFMALVDDDDDDDDDDMVIDDIPSSSLGDNPPLDPPPSSNFPPPSHLPPRTPSPPPGSPPQYDATKKGETNQERLHQQIQILVNDSFKHNIRSYRYKFNNFYQ
ncbi:unnamed protein product [Lactuca saligna]|uniref:Uncharacterized protein n=1 Tax=Lactuca saligna TaxID=75948 RepID=A0AA36EFK0_LACSI|nr:unnamed protein product [Lactuca saligna]